MRHIIPRLTSPLLLSLAAACSGPDSTELSESVEGPSGEPIASSTLAATTTLVSFTSIESDERFADISGTGGPVLFARTTASTGIESWLLRFDFGIRNNSAGFVTVGGYTATVDDGATRRTWTAPGGIIPIGSTVNVVWPDDIQGTGRMPLTLTVRAIVGSNSREITVNLKEYRSPTTSGGFRFPGRRTDLTTGLAWRVGLHSNTANQRYAYDFGIVRASGSDWTEVRTGGSASDREDYLIWEKPIYAVARGTIVSCNRLVDDHGVDEDRAPGEPIGGNNLVVDLGNGTFVKYSHFRQDTIPPALCPREGSGHRIAVSQGQALGLVGLSGNSSHPHHHIDLRDEATGASTQRSLPLRFTAFDYFPSSLPSGSTWLHVGPTVSAMPMRAIILPL